MLIKFSQTHFGSKQNTHNSRAPPHGIEKGSSEKQRAPEKQQLCCAKREIHAVFSAIIVFIIKLELHVFTYLPSECPQPGAWPAFSRGGAGAAPGLMFALRGRI